jgi:hypothetical protein
LPPATLAENIDQFLVGLSRLWAEAREDVTHILFGELGVFVDRTRERGLCPEEGVKGDRVYTIQYKRQKKPVFCPTTKRLEAFATMRAESLMRGIGSDARGFLCKKGAVVSEALVPF